MNKVENKQVTPYNDNPFFENPAKKISLLKYRQLRRLAIGMDKLLDSASKMTAGLILQIDQYMRESKYANVIDKFFETEPFMGDPTVGVCFGEHSKNRWKELAGGLRLKHGENCNSPQEHMDLINETADKIDRDAELKKQMLTLKALEKKKKYDRDNQALADKLVSGFEDPMEILKLMKDNK